MLLEVKDLIVHYNKVEAIKGISLQLIREQIVTILGANGAGKSTILRAISGIKTATRGEIWFKDQRIDQKGPREIVRLGISHVPEGKRLFLDMSVRENLLMGSYLRRDRGEVKRNLDRVFEYFPLLKDRQAQKSGCLSGGEQQMLAIGRALMSNPQLLLMDEPSLGLSPIMVQEIARITSIINQGGMSIILVEQNAFQALRLAHKGYVLETGNVVLHGDSGELRDSAYVKKAYLGA